VDAETEFLSLPSRNLIADADLEVVLRQAATSADSYDVSELPRPGSPVRLSLS
jgi:hypothetical protein